jgi:hypothetical protein
MGLTNQGGLMLKRIALFIVISLIVAGCGSFSPQPGAELSGKIDISQQKARTGKIFLNVSDDGTKISDITLWLTNVQCGGVTTGMVNLNVIVDSPLDGKRFNIENVYFGELSGSFQSPTTAGGTIYIILGKNITNTDTTCDLGTYKWSASADAK